MVYLDWIADRFELEVAHHCGDKLVRSADRFATPQFVLGGEFARVEGSVVRGRQVWLRVQIVMDSVFFRAERRRAFVLSVLFKVVRVRRRKMLKLISG